MHVHVHVAIPLYFSYRVEPPYEAGPRYKFFPPLATFDPPYPIAPDGYLPNSVVLSKLRKSQADQDLAKTWKPPSISDKQRKLMEQARIEYKFSFIISTIYSQ